MDSYDNIAIQLCPVCKRVKKKKTDWKEVSKKELAHYIKTNIRKLCCPYCEIAHRGCDG